MSSRICIFRRGEIAARLSVDMEKVQQVDTTSGLQESLCHGVRKICGIAKLNLYIEDH